MKIYTTKNPKSAQLLSKNKELQGDSKKIEKSIKDITYSLETRKEIAKFKSLKMANSDKHAKAKLMKAISNTEGKKTQLEKDFESSESSVVVRTLNNKPIRDKFSNDQARKTSTKQELSYIRDKGHDFDVSIFITPGTVIDKSFRSKIIAALEDRPRWHGAPTVAYSIKNEGASQSQEETRIGFGDINSFSSTKGFTEEFAEIAPRLSHAEKLDFFSKSQPVIEGIKQDSGPSREFSNSIDGLVSSLQELYKGLQKKSDGEISHRHNEFVAKLETWDMSGVIVGSDASASVQTAIEVNFYRSILLQELEAEGINNRDFTEFLSKIYSHENGSPLSKEEVDILIISMPEETKQELLITIKEQLSKPVELHTYSAEKGELVALKDGDISQSDFDLGMDRFLSNISGRRIVEDESGSKYAVIKEALGEGFHSEVALVQKEDTGELLVLKEPKVDDKFERHSSSVQSQLKEIDQWKKLDLVPDNFNAKPLRDGAGKLGILATFVQGESGKSLLLSGELFDKNSEKRTELINFFKGLIDKGVFVGDLSPDNIIHNGDRWVVIDTGMIIEGLSKEQAETYYKSEGNTDVGQPARYGIGEKWDKLIRKSNLPDEEKTQLREGVKKLISDITVLV